MQNINVSFEIQRDKLPPPGLHAYFLTVPVFEGDQRTDESRLKDLSPRLFEVKATLAKQLIHSTKDIKVPEHNDGESYFLLPPNVRALNVDTPEGKFTFYKNNKNEVSLIVHQCQATKWEEAFNKFYSGVTPFLDFLSFESNSPVNIDKTFCWDSKNEFFAVNYVTPHPLSNINPIQQNFPKELIPIYALYREAKSNSSYFYKFMCYYKILEGIFRHLRPRLMKEAKHRNIVLEKKKELVPSNEQLSEHHKTLVGKSIQPVFENELTKEYRNSVAHYFTDDKDILNVSDYQTSLTFQSAVILSELCCREVVATHKWYREQFNQKLRGS